MNTLLLMLIGHALGDFYFQTNKMVENQDKFVVTFVHCCLYAITMLGFLFIGSIYSNFQDYTFEQKLMIFFVFFYSHLLIDLLLPLIYRKIVEKYGNGNTDKYSFFVFVVDQFIHMSIIFCVYFFYTSLHETNIVSVVILLIFSILYLIMPSSILSSKTIALSTGESSGGFQIDDGTIIGILERIISFVLIISGTATAVGFVIAAKTMVRYGQFNEASTEANNGQTFRTKYLIGTLVSVLCALIISMIFVYLYTHRTFSLVT